LEETGKEIIKTAISGRVHRHNEAQPRKGTANKSPVQKTGL